MEYASNQFTLKLKALSESKHPIAFDLDDDYFEALESPVISGGSVKMQGMVERVGSVFTIEMDFTGEVRSTCDRCLAPLQLPINTNARLIVKFGETYREESEEIIVVSEREGVVDLSWQMYEFIVLSLPMQRMHPEGECDPEMISVMNRYSSASRADSPANADTDPRWAALASLKEKKD